MNRFPALFIGHGNPMNALEINPFTKKLNKLGEILPRPKAVLCISAHWMTKGTWVTHMPNPKTIHDFYGFPKPLFEIQYPARGSPEIAEKIANDIKEPKIQLDDTNWGLDHGTWTILKHLYPNADVPVIQLSIDLDQSPEYHFQLGKNLRNFREKEVLIIGSGNIVHNLQQIIFRGNAPAYPWATQFDEWVKERLLARDFSSLVNKATQTPAGQLSIPTWDHWFPFLVTLGAVDPSEELMFEYEGIELGSISMRCLSFSERSC